MSPALEACLDLYSVSVEQGGGGSLFQIFLFNAINITGCKVLQVLNAFENSPRGPLIQDD